MKRFSYFDVYKPTGMTDARLEIPANDPRLDLSSANGITVIPREILMSVPTPESIQPQAPVRPIFREELALAFVAVAFQSVFERR